MSKGLDSYTHSLSEVKSQKPLFMAKTLESSLDCKEIQSGHPKGDQSWMFIGRTDAEAETPILCSPHEKS